MGSTLSSFDSFAKTVERIFRKEVGAYLIYHGRDFPSCYVDLPEVYEDIREREFSKEKWQRAVEELDEFLQSLDRIKRWIRDDFEWKRDDKPPMAFKVSCNYSRMKKRIHRLRKNYLGIEYRERQGQGFYVLVYDVDTGHYVRYDHMTAYEKVVKRCLKLVKPELGQRDAFVYQTKTTKGKEVFINLIEATVDLLFSVKRDYERFVEFLSQPIDDFSQLTKPVVVKSGIEREEVFQAWKWELNKAFYDVFYPSGCAEIGTDYAIVLPGDDGSEEESVVKRVVANIEKLKYLISLVDPEILLTLGHTKWELRTPYLLKVCVPEYYRIGKSDRNSMLPFVSSLERKQRGGKREFMQYLNELEKFLKSALLKGSVERKQKKEKRLMI